ncbi:MAG: FkbM family methyltransferase [Thermoplasmatales archaeon]
MDEIRISDFTFEYNDLHDIAAIIEVHLLDVYNTPSIQVGDTVVDVGAGIGEFSVKASKLVGDAGRVIAVEPSPLDYPVLLRNIRINHCKNIIPLNVAVSINRSKMKITFKNHEFISDADSLENILLSAGVEPGEVSFMKMDIEGGGKW